MREYRPFTNRLARSPHFHRWRQRNERQSALPFASHSPKQSKRREILRALIPYRGFSFVRDLYALIPFAAIPFAISIQVGGTWEVGTTISTPICVSFAYLGAITAVCVAASVRLFWWD